MTDIRPNAKPKNVKLFPKKFKPQLKSQKIDQQALPEIQERGARYFVVALQMSFGSNLI